jgi:hypothetical protein
LGKGSAEQGGVFGENGVVACVGSAKNGYGMHAERDLKRVFKEKLMSIVGQTTLKSRVKKPNALPLSSSTV